MFVFDNFGLAKRKSAFNNPLVVEDSGISIGEKKIALENPGHLVHLFVQATYDDLGPILALNTLLDLSNKKFNGLTVLEKFVLFESKQTPSMQAVAFECLISKIRPVDFTTKDLNSAWEEVLESLGFKKPVLASLVSDPGTPELKEVKAPEAPVTSQETQPSAVKVVELVPTVTINKNPVSIVSESAVKGAEEATVDVVLKTALDEMSDDTFQALKGLMIDEILAVEKLDPSKAAVVREILMESITMDILKSENPQEAILTILYEKVVSKENFNMMVAKAEKESEKVPTTLVEALDVIDDSKPNFGRQYPKRRKGKR